MNPDRLGTAEWANPDSFASSNRFEPGKFWLGRSVADGHEALGYNDDRHICLVSGSRGGKGTATIIPNLCTWPGSVLVIDPKGENATVTAARRGSGSKDCEGMGQKVYVLDPFEKAQVDQGLRGRFNPLDSLDPDDPRTIDDAAKLADAIVVMNPDSKDPFWDESARAMVKGLILHVLTAPAFEGRQNLLTLRELIMHGDIASVEALKQIGDSDIPSGQSLLWYGISQSKVFNGVLSGIGTRFRDMAINSTKQFESVLQVVDRNTEFLDSPGMRSVLEASDFSLSDLKTDPKGVSVFLSLPQSYMSTHFRWLRMMIALFVAEMEHVSGQPASGHRVLVCLDEFAGLKRMECIETAVSQIAGFGVKLFFVLQSLEQLKSTYEKTWETFLSNAGLKIFYSIEDYFTREYVSKFIGDTEIIRTTRSSNEMEGTNEGSTEGTSTNIGESTSSGRQTTHGTSSNHGRSDGGSSSDSWESWPLFMRNTAGFFSKITGERQASSSNNWGTNTNTGTTDSEGESWTHGTTISKGKSQSTTRGTSQSSTHGESEGVHKRLLITPDEIGQYFGRIDDREDHIYPGMSLVLISGQRPSVLQKTNYFDDTQFLGRFDPHPDYMEAELPRLPESGPALAGSEPVTIPPCLGFHFRPPTLHDVDGLHLEPAVANGERVEEGAVVARLHFITTLSEFGDRGSLTLDIVSPCGGTVRLIEPGPTTLGQEVGRVMWDEVGRESRQEWTRRFGPLHDGCASRFEHCQQKAKFRLYEETNKQVTEVHNRYGYVNTPPQKILRRLTGHRRGQGPTHVTPCVSLGDVVAQGQIIGHLEHKSRGSVPVYSPFAGLVVGLSSTDGYRSLNIENGTPIMDDGWLDEGAIERRWKRLAVVRAPEGDPPPYRFADKHKYAYREFESGGRFRRVDFHWPDGLYGAEAAERRLVAVPPGSLDIGGHRSLLKEEYDIACEAFNRGRLVVQLLPGGAVERWANRNGWPTPAFGFKKAFAQRALQSREDWELAWMSSGADFFVRK